MGHFNNIITGCGKNQVEARRDAIDQFMSENGERHSVRECKPLKMVKVPPQKPVIVKNGRFSTTSYQSDPTAPQSEWLEQWSFDLHTHA